MTPEQTTHLIEQFASQCPLAVWILDSRGVAIFANAKLHELFQVKSVPSGAVGMNVMGLFDVQEDGSHHEDRRAALKRGEVVSYSVLIPHPSELDLGVDIAREEHLHLRIVAYALSSTPETPEYYVIFLEDTTSAHTHHQALQSLTDDMQNFLRSKESRKSRLDEIRAEADTLRERIKKAGQEPVC